MKRINIEASSAITFRVEIKDQMNELPTYHDRELNLFADLICGNEKDGAERAWYKKGEELPDYFRDAGLDCIDFDPEPWTSRKDWVRDRLKEYQSNKSDFVRAITHVAHPKQHRGRKSDAGTALTELNQLLAADELKAVFDGSKFRIEGEDFVFSPDVEAVPPTFLAHDVTGLIADAQFSDIVQSRFEEAAKSRSAGAHLSAVILLGSGLEGLLLGFAQSRMPTAMTSVKAPKDEHGKPKHIGDWKLSELIDVAHDLKWIQKDAHAFGHNIRDFRNLVHPYKQYHQGFEPTDEGTCRICWTVIAVVVEDLQNQVAREERQIEMTTDPLQKGNASFLE